MIIESGLVKAGLVKTGLVRAISNINTRYFRRNEGTTDYISHSAATVDRIVMDVYPSAGNVGLPTGAPAVTNNVLQTIDFAYAGTISELCKNGASYFAGIMANVKYYLNGTLIRDYPLDDNSDDLRELASGQNGTVINGNASDWGLFQQQATGEWLGQELSLISSTGLLGDDSDPEFAVVAFTADIGTGITYRAGAVFDTYAGTSDAGFTSSLSGMPAAPPFRATLASTGDFIGGEWVTTASGGVSLFGRAASVSSFSSITLKEVLNVA